jgi:hypothetical protein
MRGEGGFDSPGRGGLFLVREGLVFVSVGLGQFLLVLEGGGPY